MFLTKEISYSYYPFGMRMNGLHYTDTKLPNKYLYNGKELQDNTGYYDYGFRQLDPALGPWFVQDALAEKYKSVSAYAYVKNNPINAVDIAGLVYMSTPIMASIGTKYAGTTDLLGFLGAGTSLGTSGPTGEDYDAFISMGGGGDGSSFSEWYSLTGEDMLRDVQWSLTDSMARAWFKKFFGKPSVDVGDPTFVRVSEESSPTIPPGGDAKAKGGETTDYLLIKLYLHNQFGGGADYDIDASTMNFSFTSRKELGLLGMKKGDTRETNLFLSGINQYSCAFGKLEMTYQGNNQFSIKSNRFDFDYQPNSSFWRNAGTFMGGAVFGQFYTIPITHFSIIRNFTGLGGSFMINFKGNVYIP